MYIPLRESLWKRLPENRVPSKGLAKEPIKTKP